MRCNYDARRRLDISMHCLQDGPEYYDPPQGLMTFGLKVDHLIKQSAPRHNGRKLEDFAGHFALVNEQLKQVCRMHGSLVWIGNPIFISLA